MIIGWKLSGREESAANDRWLAVVIFLYFLLFLLNLVQFQMAEVKSEAGAGAGAGSGADLKTIYLDYCRFGNKVNADDKFSVSRSLTHCAV